MFNFSLFFLSKTKNILTLFLFKTDLSVFTYKVLATLVGVFGAAIVYTNLAGGHVKSLRRTLTSKGSGMFVTTVYGGAALGGYTMGLLVDNWSWAVAGQIQISLLCLVIAVLALLLRQSEFSE